MCAWPWARLACHPPLMAPRWTPLPAPELNCWSGLAAGLWVSRTASGTTVRTGRSAPGAGAACRAHAGVGHAAAAATSPPDELCAQPAWSRSCLHTCGSCAVVRCRPQHPQGPCQASGRSMVRRLAAATHRAQGAVGAQGAHVSGTASCSRPASLPASVSQGEATVCECTRIMPGSTGSCKHTPASAASLPRCRAHQDAAGHMFGSALSWTRHSGAAWTCALQGPDTCQLWRTLKPTASGEPTTSVGEPGAPGPAAPLACSCGADEVLAAPARPLARGAAGEPGLRSALLCPACSSSSSSWPPAPPARGGPARASACSGGGCQLGASRAACPPRLPS